MPPGYDTVRNFVSPVRYQVRVMFSPCLQAKCRISLPFTSISRDKIVYMFITTSTVCMHMSNLLKTSILHASSETSYSCL